MRIVQLTDKTTIEAFCRKDAGLHVYSLGDLDDFFWPRTTWWGGMEGDQLKDLILLYAGDPIPTLVALSGSGGGGIDQLLAGVLDRLPDRCYAHVTPHLGPVLKRRFSAQLLGQYYRMAWRWRSWVTGTDCHLVGRLDRADLGAIQALYDIAYPAGRLDPRMIDTGYFRGVQIAGQLVSVAGVHVYSREYGVAALGNIATHPEFRKQRYGTRVIGCLCADLDPTVETVGLNVKQDNTSAIACYLKLGFENLASFSEYLIER